MTKQEHNECAECIRAMQKASDAFYHAAVRTGNHAFVEWTGLLNEYIKACQQAADVGVDFRQLNKHTGEGLALPGHALDYINEKLECIFTGAIKVVPAGGEKA